MKRLPIILFLAVIVIVAGTFISKRFINKPSIHTPIRKVEKIVYKAVLDENNDIEIVANYWEGMSGKAIILLHMMPSTKETWNVLGDSLNQEGFHVLAIDLRGHGESIRAVGKNSNTNKAIAVNYKKFSDQEHQAAIHDIEGAREWLIRENIPPSNIYVGGASLGANLALQYIALHVEAPGGFFLSPGLDYRGIITKPLLNEISAGQRLFFIAAEDDVEAASASDTLHENTRGFKKIRIFEKGGHGTEILESHPELISEILSWLNEG